ncbi:MAG: PhnE/PtxC family ABC transporter permease [Planctomycetota bacterium]|jgi:phosphonate transport system permease protein
MSSVSVDSLYRARPRNRFLRISLIALLVLLVLSWTTGNIRLDLTSRRLANVERFLDDITPAPLHDSGFDLVVLWKWAMGILERGGFEAALSTLSISIVAIVLAMVLAFLLCFPAARNLAHPEPFLPTARRPSPLRVGAWRMLMLMTRTALIFLRAIPEYVWAFLLVAMLGLNAWPAILALAIHNSGILGRLCSETVENTPPGTLAALRGLGASRTKIITVAVLPTCFSRFLLYFFYRWETCVREATVLGMLGIASLGFAVKDARAAWRYDEMIFLILLGSLIVILGDFLSAIARRQARLA